jgi:hydroxysqualene dehydroxylase
MPESRQSVIVLGAGPAGLTAAYRLIAGGRRVTVLSPSSMAGAQIQPAGSRPATVLGCHQATWTLLESLGIGRNGSSFAESTLEFLLPDGRLARYPRTRFPTPIQQLVTIGRFSGLARRERWKLLSWLEQLWEGSLHLAPDLEHRTARHWLESQGYSRTSLDSVWNPLASWLAGNDLEHLSADAFVMAVKPFFLSGGSNSRIWVSRQSADRLLVEPIKNSLIKRGATLARQAEAVGFEFQDERISGIRLRDGRTLHADWYVSAVPPARLTPLLPERWLTRYAYFQQIADLVTLPCTLVHAHAAAVLAIPRHILLGSGRFQWVACVPLGSERHLSALLVMPRDRPGDDSEHHVITVLRSLNLLEAGHRLTGFSQYEIAAGVLSLSPGTKVRRPIQHSPIANLLLAGAWTDTGWPANLESAVVSGERCAEIILARTGVPP